MEDHELRNVHMKLLSLDKTSRDRQEIASRAHEIKTAPLFTYPVRALINEGSMVESFPQHCLLAGDLTHDGSSIIDSKDGDGTGSNLLPSENGIETSTAIAKTGTPEKDPRIFLNVDAPWSAFICGSQGSGKSYTMSCMLESCLIASHKLGNLLPSPLAGLVFHYDKHSGTAGAVSEAAYLCSAGIPVTVLVSESNQMKMKRIYGGIQVPSDNLPKVKVLKFNSRHINLERMMSLMCVSAEGKKPLYMEALIKVLRDMAINLPDLEGINYAQFMAKIGELKLTSDQTTPLKLRLDLLESFLEGKWVTEEVTEEADKRKRRVWKPTSTNSEDLWIPKPGALTIVDLSCPFIDESSACVLFSMCLSLFLENDSIVNTQNSSESSKMEQKKKEGCIQSHVGKIVALDEAHKYMTSTPGSDTFTSSLLATIRMQRHYGVRVIIATQEPTISPALMDLSSITLVHRFTSPRWMTELKNHLPGVGMSKRGQNVITEDEVFAKIVDLATGDALLFCSSALLSLSEEGIGRESVKKMGVGWKEVRIRKRVTTDGGMSEMAS